MCDEVGNAKGIESVQESAIVTSYDEIIAVNPPLMDV